ERLLDLVSYFIIIAITILIQVKTVSDFVNEKIAAIADSEVNMPGWMVIAGIFILMALFYFIVRFLLVKYNEHSLAIKFRKLQVGLKEGFLTIKHLKKKKLFLAHTVFIWTMYLLQIYVGFYALSETAHLNIQAAFSVLSLSTLAMIISPGGIGAFPVAVQQVLLIYHLDNISFGWLMWG